MNGFVYKVLVVSNYNCVLVFKDKIEFEVWLNYVYTREIDL